MYTMVIKIMLVSLFSENLMFYQNNYNPKFKRKKIFIPNYSLILACLFFSSCVSKIPLHSFEEEIPKTVPDYTTLDQWIAHPDKFDNSDLFEISGPPG